MSCVYFGEQVGSVVVTCCGGKEKLAALHECRDPQRLSQYACTEVPDSGLANIVLKGQPRTVKQITGCKTCPHRKESIIQQLAAPKPRKAVQTKSMARQAKAEYRQQWEQMRAARKVQTPKTPTKLALDVNAYSMSDVVLVAWMAEGIRRLDGQPLTMFADGERAQLLDFLGHKPESASGSSTIMVPTYMDCHPVGSPPVVVAKYNKLGFPGQPSRPATRPLSADVSKWANERKRDVLLFTQSEGPPWPFWTVLRDKLKISGLSVMLIRDSSYKSLLADIPRFAALIAAAGIVIGQDHLAVHLAGTLDKPAIALLGRTSDVMFSHAPSVRCVQAERWQVPCAGCWLGWGYNPNECERSCKALEAVTVERVLDAMSMSG